MTTYGSEERALEAMRKELAAERAPDLPWNDMERELLAKLDEAPMTSHPRSLDARVDDVPVVSVRHPRSQVARVGAFVFAAAAAFALFWISPLHSGKPIVVSTATPSVEAPASSNLVVPPVFPEVPAEVPAPVPAPKASVAVPAPTRTLTMNDVKAALSACVPADKPGARPAKNRKLTVLLGADGRISTVRFEPALGASVNQCVLDSLRTGRFVGRTSPVTMQF